VVHESGADPLHGVQADRLARALGTTLAEMLAELEEDGGTAGR
jgi:hypothetical protein